MYPQYFVPGLPPPTYSISSITVLYLQEYQRHIKSTFRHQHSDHNKALVHSRVEEALHRGDETGVIVRMATQSEASPALTARMVLDAHYNDVKNDKQVSTCPGLFFL